MQPIRIGDRLVGPGHPVYIIAEAGVNHDGGLEKALRLCDAAKEAGADAVKFQAFHADELAGADAKQAAYQSRNTGRTESQRDMLKRLELSPFQFAEIMRHCRDIGIEFLASPFGEATLGEFEYFVTEVNHRMPAVKVASQQLIDLPMLAGCGKLWRDRRLDPVPVLLSTGAATIDLIDQAIGLLRSDGIGEIALLHCVASYPTPFDRQSLLAICAMVKGFDLPVGYSDHSVDVDSGQLAVACGACILEKHFTLSHDDKGPDHAVSLEPGDLAEYIRKARRALGALGREVKEHQDIELESRDVSRKALAAKADIAKGTVIASAADVRNFIATRPRGTGSPATNAHLIWGRAFTKDVAQGDIIREDMLGEAGE